MAAWRSGSTAHDEAFSELVEWWEDLVDGRGSHVVLVPAPSGWGRSTLLDRLASHVREHPEPVRVLEVPTGEVAAARLGPGVQVEWLASLLEPDLQGGYRELAGADRLAGQLNLGLGVTGLFLGGMPAQAALLLAATGISVAEAAWDRSAAGPPRRVARLASLIARVSVGIPVVVIVDDADDLAPDLATSMVRKLVERIDGQVLVVVAVDPGSSELARRLRGLQRDAVLVGRVHALDIESGMDEPERLTLISQLADAWPRAAKSRLAARAQSFAEVFKVRALDGAASLGTVVDEADALQQLDKLIAAAGWGRRRPVPSWAALVVAWAGGLLHREQLVGVLAALGKPTELGDQVATIGPWARLADPGGLSELRSAAHGKLDHESEKASRVIIDTAAELVADPRVDLLSRFSALRAVQHLVADGMGRLQAGEAGLLTTLARDLAQLGDITEARAVTDTGFKAASAAEDHSATAALYALRLQLDRQRAGTRGEARMLADQVHNGADPTMVGLEARVWATVVRLEDPATHSTEVGEVEALADELDQYVGPVATWWRLLLSYYVGRAGHPGLSQDLLQRVLSGASQAEDRETAEWILYAVGGPQADLRLYLIALQAGYERLAPDASAEDRLRLEAALAGTNADLARYGEALRHARQELRLRTRLYGPDHADTLATRGNLAHWTGQGGDPRGARRLLEELLPDVRRVLGPDHPDTLVTRTLLATWTGRAGNPQEARRLFEELLPDQERVLGPDDSGTLTVRNNLALWTGDAGNPSEARRLFEELVPDLSRVLGPGHPDTLATRANLATWTGNAGDARKAHRLLKQLLPKMRRVLGPDHPNTLITRANLATWTGNAGDARKAHRLFEQLLPKMRRVLGPNHPDTLRVRHELGRLSEGRDQE